MAKSKSTAQLESDDVKTEVRPGTYHKCECMCLKNIPGYPYRVGYAKVYVDIKNKTRCVYCDCLSPDPRAPADVFLGQDALAK